MPPSKIAVAGDSQLTRFKNVSMQGEVAALDTGDISLIVMTNPKYQVVIRRIVINVYTLAAVPTVFQSDGAGADPVWTVPASPPLGEDSIDWGKLGYALPLGEGLEIALGAGGNAFTFAVEAYCIPSATMTPAQMTAG